jgi:hypothetical protein
LRFWLKGQLAADSCGRRAHRKYGVAMCVLGGGGGGADELVVQKYTDRTGYPSEYSNTHFRGSA